MTDNYRELPACKAAKDFNPSEVIRVYTSGDPLTVIIEKIVGDHIMATIDNQIHAFHFKCCRKLESPKIYWMKRETPNPTWQVRITPPLPTDSGWVKVREVLD